MNRSRSLFGFDVSLLAAVVCLMAIGILFVFSSGVSSTGAILSNEYIRQIVWVVVGLVILFVIAFSNYGRIGEWSPYIYLAVLVVLVFTLFFGRVVNGARSWLPIAGVGIQPAEFGKVSAVLFLAYYYDRSRGKRGPLVRFATGAGIVTIPVLLILLQPDMGTALVYAPIFIAMSFFAEVRTRYLFFVIIAGAIVVFLTVLPAWHFHLAQRDIALILMVSSSKYLKYATLICTVLIALSAVGFFILKRPYFYWIIYAFSIVAAGIGGSVVLRQVLKEYQIKRLIVFIDPGVDPRGAGWNVIQSVTAVGSGGLFGKGWLRGTQSHYRYLPQQSTDFIFSILAEEWGFIGSVFVFLLYLLIMYRGLIILLSARDMFASYVCAGVVAMISFHVFVNIGMAMGIMPITGIPLFFLSYGGSSLWTALIGVGLMLNIHLRRYHY